MPELVVAALTLTLGLLTRPTTLTDFDAGELVTLATRGGIAHPPGYPLYTLLLRGVAALVEPSVAALSSLSVALAAAGAVVLCRASRRLGASSSSAAAATVVVFAATPVWRAATNVEPFALHLLLTAAVALSVVALCDDDRRARTRGAALAGLALGLGLAHHHSLATALPVVAWALLRGPGRLERLLPFSLAAAVGALPLLSLFFVDLEGGAVWGDWSDRGARFFPHLLRLDYGSFSLSAGAEGTAFTGASAFAWRWLLGLGGLFALPVLVGALQAREPASRGRAARALVGLLVLCGPGFALLVRLGGTPLEGEVVERFFAMPLFVSGPLLAVGLDRLRQLAGRERLAAAVLAVLVAAHVAVQAPAADRSDETLYEAHLMAVFEVAGDGAVVVTASDSALFGILWGREVAGLGDVQTLAVGLMGQPWYRQRLHEELGVPPDETSLPALLQELSRERPVYLASTRPWQLSPLLGASYPIGPLVRLSGEAPAPAALFDRSVVLFSRLAVEERARLSAWERSLLGGWQRTFHALVPALERVGDEPRARRAAALVAELERLTGEALP